MRVVGEVPVGGLLVVKLLFSKEGVQERINEYLIKVIILHIFSALLILQNEELSPEQGGDERLKTNDNQVSFHMI